MRLRLTRVVFPRPLTDETKSKHPLLILTQTLVNRLESKTKVWAHPKMRLQLPETLLAAIKPPLVSALCHGLIDFTFSGKSNNVQPEYVYKRYSEIFTSLAGESLKNRKSEVTSVIIDYQPGMNILSWKYRCTLITKTRYRHMFQLYEKSFFTEYLNPSWLFLWRKWSIK